MFARGGGWPTHSLVLGIELQTGETMPLVEELLGNLRVITCDLEPHQLHTFYEAVGYMISAVPPSEPVVQVSLAPCHPCSLAPVIEVTPAVPPLPVCACRALLGRDCALCRVVGAVIAPAWHGPWQPPQL
jgi:hypothetical protein